MSTASTTTDGGRAATRVYPECRQVQNDDLDGALRKLWNTLCEVPPDEMQRRRETADRIAAAAAEYEATRRRRRAGPVPTEHAGFLEAFDSAVAAATGLQRREAARLAAKGTVRFLVEHADGRTVERLTGIYVRYGSGICRAEGARLAAELEATPGKVRDPLSILQYRCKEGGKA